ncbi:MAG: Ppx/GppA phosphatase family protein [Limisphaerales bacterium]
MNTGRVTANAAATPSTMNPLRRAVIDVGTNSVKLLVAEVDGHTVKPLLEQSEQTRLGRGFYETHQLQAAAIANTARAVAEFAAIAAEWRAASTRVIATSAARDALNQAELVQAVQQASGLRVEILTGEQEADWVFHGVTSDPRLAGQPLLILDVGGGSTEFVLGENAIKYFRESFRLGSVRLLEQCRPADPPAASALPDCLAGLRAFLRQQIRPALAPAVNARSPRPVQLVGTGGAASILVSIQLGLRTFERERIETAVLTRTQVAAQLERLWSLPLVERKQIVGLPPERADVMLTGAAIYAAVMEEFGFPDLRVSTRGLRFAALMGWE